MLCLRVLRAQFLSKLFIWLPLIILIPPSSFSTPNFEKFSSIVSSQYGVSTNLLASQFVTLISSLTNADTGTKINEINDFFNSNIKFTDDIILWGEEDYWASPLETIAKGAGDCEDFTIAKFVALRLLEIPLDKLRLTYVKVKIGGPTSNISMPHMVLSYYDSPSSIPLILDNLSPVVKSANQRPDLTPVFGFNSEKLWVGGTNNASGYDPKSRISRWQKTLVKIHNEGLD